MIRAVKACLSLLGGIAVLPLLAVLWVVRPWLRVRLLFVAAHRFGHLALEPEIELANQSLRSATKPKLINLYSFGSRGTQSNRYLVRLWKKRIHSAPNWFFVTMRRCGKFFPGLALDCPQLSILGSLNELDRVAQQCPKPPSFTRKDIDVLAPFSFDPRQPYVAVVVRDPSYYASQGERDDTNSPLRNAELSTFEDAAKYLVKEGFQVVRLGTPSIQRFPAIFGVLDYANSVIRSEELDIKLAMSCEFAISTQTGPDAVALVGRRPVLYLDVLRISQFFLGTRLASWYPMRIEDSTTGQRLSLKQYFENRLTSFKLPNEFYATGLHFSRSTGAEIRDYVADYLDERRRSADPEIMLLREESNSRLQSALAGADCEKFGKVVAPVSRLWLKRHGKSWLA